MKLTKILIFLFLISGNLYWFPIKADSSFNPFFNCGFVSTSGVRHTFWVFEVRFDPISAWAEAAIAYKDNIEKNHFFISYFFQIYRNYLLAGVMNSNSRDQLFLISDVKINLL